jgi:hypothetical protein
MPRQPERGGVLAQILAQIRHGEVEQPGPTDAINSASISRNRYWLA